MYTRCKISRSRIPNSLCSACAKALFRGVNDQKHVKKKRIQQDFTRKIIERNYDNDDNDACIYVYYIYIWSPPQDLPRHICIYIYMCIYTTVKKTFWFLASAWKHLDWCRDLFIKPALKSKAIFPVQRLSQGKMFANAVKLPQIALG